MSATVLNRLLLEIASNVSEKEAKRSSDAIFEKRITPALERVLKEYEDADIFIDQPLELELGALSESELEYALENALRKSLEPYLQDGTERGRRMGLHRQNRRAEEHGMSMEMDLLLDYLQYPVLPWDWEEGQTFDLPSLLKEATQQSAVSAVFVRQLSDMVFGDLETCRRFFLLPFEAQDFRRMMERMLDCLPVSGKAVCTHVLQHLETDSAVNPIFGQQLMYYLLSCVVFGNRQDKNVSMLVAALYLLNETEAVLTQRQHRQSKPADFSLQTEEDEEEIVSSNRKRQEKGMQDLSLKIKRLLESVDATFRIEKDMGGSFSEARDRIAALWEDELWVQYLSRKQGASTAAAFSSANVSQDVYSGQLSMAGLLHVAETLEEILHDTDGTGERQLSTEIRQRSVGQEAFREQGIGPERTEEPQGETGKTYGQKYGLQEAHAAQAGQGKPKTLVSEQLTKGQPEVKEGPGIRELTRQFMHRQPEIKERIPVYNAGLVLLQPFLISFFDRLGLLENRRAFKSEACQERAACMLHYLTEENEPPLEHVMFLNKLLCGINILFPIGAVAEPCEFEKQECHRLLQAVIHNWSVIRNTSVSGFRESFLRRNGVLEKSRNDWILRVEPKGMDILLDDIPWDIHVHSYPWNNYVIFVEWNS